VSGRLGRSLTRTALALVTLCVAALFGLTIAGLVT
jgi:hypothetical protein